MQQDDEPKRVTMLKSIVSLGT